jgi:porphobilinogen synthase
LDGYFSRWMAISLFLQQPPMVQVRIDNNTMTKNSPRHSTFVWKKETAMLIRPRRNRRSSAIRGLVRETRLSPAQLIQPLFLLPGTGQRSEVASLPGTFRMSLDVMLPEIGECMAVGVRSFIVFPAVPDALKDKTATYSYASDNFYLQAATAIKAAYPDCCLISDVAMDPYSIDGHDGLVGNRRILNDASLPILAKMAVAQAQAGFDLLGPSDMMDGRIGYIRQALDAAGFEETGIMAYTAKYASAFYGPFRAALDSAPRADDDIPADKKTYQMDPANTREALREAELDAAEGADFLMVKPALHYMDIIALLKANSGLPIAAYHVSGECAMLLAACRNGWLDYEKAMPETLLGIHRAGADVILTYFAKDYAIRYARG